MKILAIDPGLSCGWSFYEGTPAKQPFRPQDSGHTLFGTWDLKGNRFEGAGYRYIRFRNYLEGFCKINPIDIVFYEEVRKHLGTDAAHIYGAIVGQIQMFCEEKKIPYKSIPTGTWKKATVGKGNANKDQVLEYAQTKWQGVRSYDEADALCILEAALKCEVFGV